MVKYLPCHRFILKEYLMNIFTRTRFYKTVELVYVRTLLNPTYQCEKR
jgi:hypothetical protein